MSILQVRGLPGGAELLGQHQLRRVRVPGVRGRAPRPRRARLQGEDCNVHLGFGQQPHSLCRQGVKAVRRIALLVVNTARRTVASEHSAAAQSCKSGKLETLALMHDFAKAVAAAVSCACPRWHPLAQLSPAVWCDAAGAVVQPGHLADRAGRLYGGHRQRCRRGVLGGAAAAEPAAKAGRLHGSGGTSMLCRHLNGRWLCPTLVNGHICLAVAGQ